MRRGFQAAAQRLAAEVRGELGLEPDDRFDPHILADAYGVPVVSIQDLEAEGATRQEIRQLTVVDPGCFSAGTVFVGTARLIVYNPRHSAGRHSNSVAHEMSHVLLEHLPGPALGYGGCRVWDADVEAEADALAGMLLITRDAALACARVGLPHSVGAARFGVSPQLMGWRTNHSGAARQAGAEARRRRRAVPSLRPIEAGRLPACGDMTWLSALSAFEWREVLRRCADAIAAKAVQELSDVLAP